MRGYEMMGVALTIRDAMLSVCQTGAAPVEGVKGVAAHFDPSFEDGTGLDSGCRVNSGLWL